MEWIKEKKKGNNNDGNLMIGKKLCHFLSIFIKFQNNYSISLAMKKNEMSMKESI